MALPRTFMASSRLFPRPSPLRPKFECSSAPPRPLAPPPPTATNRNKLVTRRSISAALVVLHCLSSSPNRADAGGLFDKYVKRKKLDPLEVYLPAVLLAEAQFKGLEKSLDLDQPNYDISRSLLRSGPAASLRVNIRAVAQYASEDGKGKLASDAVDKCLTALEDLDSLLLRALRKDSSASVGAMRSKIDVALGALDSLLQTVPVHVLDKGKAIAEAYGEPSYLGEESKPGELDKDMKELESIL